MCVIEYTELAANMNLFINIRLWLLLQKPLVQKLIYLNLHLAVFRVYAEESFMKLCSAHEVPEIDPWPAAHETCILDFQQVLAQKYVFY